MCLAEVIPRLFITLMTCYSNDSLLIILLYLLLVANYCFLRSNLSYITLLWKVMHYIT